MRYSLQYVANKAIFYLSFIPLITFTKKWIHLNVRYLFIIHLRVNTEILLENERVLRLLNESK